MNEKNADFDDRLRAAFGSPGAPDFTAWQARHFDAVAHLNPVVTSLKRRKRRWLMWIARPAAVAGLCAALIWILSPGKESFAQTVESINDARSITWTTTFYERVYSADESRSWLKAERSTRAYMEPGLYRDTRYDEDGNASWIEIVDMQRGAMLRLDMKAKKATRYPYSPKRYDPDGPFDWIADAIEKKPLELVGQRTVNGKRANVFRYRQEQSRDRESVDIWLDAQTKEFVGYSLPGADYFDPETDPDRNNPAEEKWSRAEVPGAIFDEIVLDANLDRKLFDLTPPEGFEIVEKEPRPIITEAEMIDYLAASARFNGGIFPDTAGGVDSDQFNKAADKDETDRTEAEQALIELQYEAIRNWQQRPTYVFVEQHAVRDTFRYLGKGVKLGDADRIVCWYKLKNSDTYRAVFGDLTVKDVAPKDLPLPVEE